MIFYLVKKYLTLSLVLVFALSLFTNLAFGIAFRDIIPMATLFSGIISPIMINKEFQNQKLWPLFDNLRLPKYPVLGFLAGINFILYVALRICMS
jgi:hypothetical protein